VPALGIFNQSMEAHGDCSSTFSVFWRGHIHDLLVGEGARGVSKAIAKTPLDTT